MIESRSPLQNFLFFISCNTPVSESLCRNDLLAEYFRKKIQCHVVIYLEISLWVVECFYFCPGAIYKYPCSVDWFLLWETTQYYSFWSTSIICVRQELLNSSLLCRWHFKVNASILAHVYITKLFMKKNLMEIFVYEDVRFF